MANRNTNLGGTDWSEEKLTPTDLNDTFDAVYDELVIDEQMYTIALNNTSLNLIRQTLDRAITLNPLGGEWCDVYTDSTGRFNTINTTLTTCTFDSDNYYFASTGLIVHNISSLYVPTNVNKCFAIPLMKTFASGNTVQYKLESVDYKFSMAFRGDKLNSLATSLIEATESTPTGFFMKPDGTKIFIIGTTNDVVYEATLSVPFELKSYGSIASLSVSGTVVTAQGLFFSPDGTKMYIVDGDDDQIHQYDLSTAWDVTSGTTTYNYDVTAKEATPWAVAFNSDGTKMYVGGNNEYVYEYDLSTAWRISTASFLQQIDLTSEIGDYIGSIKFNSGGTKMFISDATKIYEYALSTAWDVTSATLTTSRTLSATTISDFAFSSDGSKFMVLDSTNDLIEYYESPDGDSSDTGYMDVGDVKSFTAFTKAPNKLTIKLAQGTSTINGYPAIYGFAVLTENKL